MKSYYSKADAGIEDPASWPWLWRRYIGAGAKIQIMKFGSVLKTCKLNPIDLKETEENSTQTFCK